MTPQFRAAVAAALRFGVIALLGLTALLGQQPKPDAAGCTDSKFLPRVRSCRIDNCETREADRKDIPTGRDPTGEAITTEMEGESRAIMYECADTTTPMEIGQYASTTLRIAGFDLPYTLVEDESYVSA